MVGSLRYVVGSDVGRVQVLVILSHRDANRAVGIATDAFSTPSEIIHLQTGETEFFADGPKRGELFGEAGEEQIINVAHNHANEFSVFAGAFKLKPGSLISRACFPAAFSEASRKAFEPTTRSVSEAEDSFSELNESRPNSGN